MTCCGRYLIDNQHPDTPEKLMRSRYSAYVTGNFQYILDTYAPKIRASLSIDLLSQDHTSTKWASLVIVNSSKKNQVEFKATYQFDNEWFILHEESTFIQLDNQWFYLDGKMLKSNGQMKPGRNDLCPCDSGKKFKKCCG